MRIMGLGRLRGKGHWVLGVLVSLSFWGILCSGAFSATFEVDRFNDVVDVGPRCDDLTLNDCSLREAVIEANNNGEADTIVLPEGTYTLSIAGTGESDAAQGDLDLTDDVIINGSGADTTTIEATGLGDRVFHVLFGSLVEQVIQVTINDMTITGGTAPNLGGLEEDGGAIFLGSGDDGGATLNINNTTIMGNQAVTGTGAGGGIKAIDRGTLTISRCTISNNECAGVGGGIHSEGATVTISNSTIDGNTAGTGGGAIANDGGSTLTIINSTLSDSTAGGGLDNDATAELSNTILSNNTGGNCAGTLTSNGNNLSDDDTCTASFTQPGDLTNTDPLLGALADNGGPTLTRALLPGSPAIDAGLNAEAAGTNDQRGAGFARIANGTVDIGAFELQKYTLTIQTAGDGAGNVASSPPGIDCGSDCSEEFNEGTDVMLTATPGADSTFSGWSGGSCSGTGTCTVTMSSDIFVTATFASTEEPGNGEPEPPSPEPVCENIVDAAPSGVELAPPSGFVKAGNMEDSQSFAWVLGLIISSGKAADTVELTPRGQSSCTEFNWKVYDINGEDITAEAGAPIGGRCFGFELTGAEGTYYVEAVCDADPAELYAFPIVVR